MRKYICFFVVLFTVILTYVIRNEDETFYGNGEILLNFNLNEGQGIYLYNVPNKEFRKVSSDGAQAIFWDNDNILIERFDKIVKHNIITQDEGVFYEGISFDYFQICNNKNLSISRGNCIFLYNIADKTETILVEDNGKKIHSWSPDGKILYYSDIYNTIKAVDINSGEIVIVCKGRNPVVFGDKIAYENNSKLTVKDMETHEEYEYNGSVYSYCFSPTGSELLIEDEISMGTFIRNFFNNGIVLGHSIIVWDYANNKRNTLVDSCVSVPNLICDWW